MIRLQALVRKHQAVKAVTEMVKDHKARTSIVAEILTTERTYVDILRQIVEVRASAGGHCDCLRHCDGVSVTPSLCLCCLRIFRDFFVSKLLSQTTCRQLNALQLFITPLREAPTPLISSKDIRAIFLTNGQCVCVCAHLMYIVQRTCMRATRACWYNSSRDGLCGARARQWVMSSYSWYVISARHSSVDLTQLLRR